MQIGRVRFACIEFYDNALALKIDSHVSHAVYFHEHGSQFPHAHIAIFAFGRNLDRLQNGMIRALGSKRIARVGFVWSCRVH